MKNSADKGGCYTPRASGWWIVPSFICRILHILLSLILIIAKYTMPTWTKGVSYWSPSLTLSTNLESRALELIPTLTGEATLCCITKANTCVWAGWWANDKSLWCYNYGRACHGWNIWCSSHFFKTVFIELKTSYNVTVIKNRIITNYINYTIPPK